MKNTRDEVEEMRNARKTANAVYMRFTEDSINFPEYAFCFFEGEDIKYYHSRIKYYFSNEFIPYTTGNKKEVLKLLEKIENEFLYNDMNTMFFIDNDFDKSLKEKSVDLYETPCYSIENLYVQKECFEDIIQSEFGVNKAHQDYSKCVVDFENRFNEFMNIMETFNALIILRREKSDLNSNVRFGLIKTTHLVDINIGSVKRASKYQDNIKEIVCKLGVCDEEIQRCILDLKKMNNRSEKFRGKNQLDFFCLFLEELKNSNKSGSYFSEKHDCVKLNTTGNRLSELSQYAITPDCLKTFLRKHSKILAS